MVHAPGRACATSAATDGTSLATVRPVDIDHTPARTSCDFSRPLHLSTVSRQFAQTTQAKRSMLRPVVDPALPNTPSTSSRSTQLAPPPFPPRRRASSPPFRLAISRPSARSPGSCACPYQPQPRGRGPAQLSSSTLRWRCSILLETASSPAVQQPFSLIRGHRPQPRTTIVHPCPRSLRLVAQQADTACRPSRLVVPRLSPTLPGRSCGRRLVPPTRQRPRLRPWPGKPVGGLSRSRTSWVGVRGPRSASRTLSASSATRNSLCVSSPLLSRCVAAPRS